MGVGHHGCSALLATDRHVDIDVHQGVEDRQKAFARDTEDMLDTLGHQLTDQDLAAGAGGRG